MAKKSKAGQGASSAPASGSTRGTSGGSSVPPLLAATNCPSCGCREGTPVGEPLVQQHRGLTPAGTPYQRIVRQRVRCDVCGQVRIDRSYE